MSAVYGLFALIGRALIAGFFIKAGYDKILAPEGVQGMIDGLGFGLPAETVFAVIALEIVAPLLLLLGVWARLSALALAAFTIAASVLFHNFWAMALEQQFIQSLLFYKNVAVAGGLLMIVGFGAGPLSLQRQD